VQSAVIKMVRNDVRELPCAERDFREVVKNAFGMRRKTMRNSLRALVNQWQPEHAAEILQDPLFNLRAEQLSVQQFIDLTIRLRK
jgi:16S rRNA (adenine1518-N6/adenine1519-N6)-dimethyltransferase